MSDIGFDYQNTVGEDGPDDEPTFTDGGITRQHVAKRDLACVECPFGRGIRKGERYEVHVGLDDDGVFATHRYCLAQSDGCLEEPELPFPPRERRTPPAPPSPFDDIPF